MLDLSSKYSINIKTTSETFTINSTLQPNLSQYDSNKVSVIWFRQPPPPYQIEQLAYNNNKKSYKCNSLDYQCSIICKVFNENGKELNRFDYGPIQTFMYNRLSANLQFRVQVLLFNNVKKCLLSFSHVPTLINPQNNNKYQLTQQDIRSIYLKSQNSVEDNQKQQLDQISLLNSKKKKVIVVQNLFQRLILLKLFHQIPNSMYCHSMEILQILFYDQTSCNMTLYALNRFKYQKKQTSQTSKSMFNQPCQQLVKSKWMKKSNESLTKYKNINNSNNNQKQSLLLLNKEKCNNQSNNLQGFKKTFQLKINQSITKKQLINQIQPKREFIPLIGLKKSPKESINSGTQSIISGQSSLATQSKKSLHQLSNQQKESLAQRQRQINKTHNKKSLSPGQLKRISTFKQPKVSILSTQINSIKGPRQQKPSFPQSPLGINLTNTLKSSQLLIKPNQFKSSLALRRSQDEIKTPRIDMDDDQQQAKIKKKILQAQPRNEKNILQESNTSLAVNINSNTMMEQSTSQYFNEFQNLLFEGQKSQNQQTQQMCLNDSFIRMEEQQQRQKQKNLSAIHITQSQQSLQQDLPFLQNLVKTHSVIQNPSLTCNLTVKQTFLPSSPTKSQRNIISLKQKFIAIVQQNHQLKMKNEQLIKQIEESKSNTQKKSQITKYQQEIQKMKIAQNNLQNEINLLKSGAVNGNKRSFIAKNGNVNLLEGSSIAINTINNIRPNEKLEIPQKIARNIFPNSKDNTTNQYMSNKGNQLSINTNNTYNYVNSNYYTGTNYYANNNYTNNNYQNINQFNNQPHAYQFNQLNDNRFKINQANSNHQPVQLNQMIGQANSKQTILKVQNNYNKFPNQDYKPSSGITSPPRQSKHINAIIMNNDNITSPKLAGRRSQQGDKVCFGNRDGLGNTTSNLFSSGDVRFIKFSNDPDYQKFRTNQSYSYKLNTSNNKVQEHNKPFKESYYKY